MAWTREQFIKFCSKAGVDPAKALSEEKIDLRSPEKKAQYTADRVRGINKTNKIRKKHEQKRRSHAINNLPGKVQNSEREPDPALALGQEICEQDPRLGPTRARYALKITGYRVNPIDPDNFLAGCKGIIDGLVKSGIIPGDDWKTTTISADQIRVKTWNDEGTLIEITIPEKVA